MPATSAKPLGLVNDPTVGEHLDEQVVAMRIAGYNYFESVRDGIARGSLFAALFAVAGPREGLARGYLTESVELTGAAGTFSLASNDTARYDGNGYVAGLCPWKAEVSSVLEERAAIFNVEHSDASLKSIPFSNTAATTYYVGVTCATLPTVAEQLPRTGVFAYTQEKTVIGLKVRPQTVTDLGGSQIKLDFATDAQIGTHSLAGRTAVVYKTSPEATTATAIASGTITFAGPTNSVTVGYLGQSVPSTTPGDYVVVILGPVCTNNGSVVGTDGYAHVGTLVGATYVADTDSQDVIPTMLGFMRDVIDVGRPSSNTARQNAFKISIRAKAGETGENQLSVLDSGATPVFYVDETGATTALSLALSALLAAAAITCTTLTASGLITANGGIDLAGNTLDANNGEITNLNRLQLGGAGPHVEHAGNDIIVEFDEASDRTLEVRNIGANMGRIEAGEIQAVTSNGGSGKMLANIYERGLQYDFRLRASALKNHNAWLPGATGGGAFAYNAGGGTPPYSFVNILVTGAQTFHHVLNLRPGDEIVDVGCLAWRNAIGTSAVTVSLRTWLMDGNGPTITHHVHTHGDTTAAFVETASALGAPVAFPSTANARFVLEIVLTNDGVANDTARLAFAFVSVRRVGGADMTLELPVGG